MRTCFLSLAKVTFFTQSAPLFRLLSSITETTFCIHLKRKRTLIYPRPYHILPLEFALSDMYLSYFIICKNIDKRPLMLRVFQNQKPTDANTPNLSSFLKPLIDNTLRTRMIFYENRSCRTARDCISNGSTMKP